MALEIKPSQRLQALPPYLFAEIDKQKREAIKKGADIINLGIGDPDQPTPKHIIEELSKAANDSKNHQYALDLGMPLLRDAISEWYEKRFNVKLNPETEVLPLIGSKEGIGHIPLAVINPGDEVLIPDPAYPVYKSGTIFAGGVPHIMPLLKENSFLPDLKNIDPQVANKAKMMFLNYPNNPTASVASREFFEETVKFAEKYGIIVCHDGAYSEMAYDGFKPLSFLEIEGAKGLGVEFHSLSKTYNMTGWRIGFAVGNTKIISYLGKIKSNLDSGIFQAIQLAGITALKGPQEHIKKMQKMYEERRNILVDGLNNLGWQCVKPKATFYVWLPVPSGYTSTELTMFLLKNAGIVTTPGNGFGKNGEGFIRMSLTTSKENIVEAINRIKKIYEAGKMK
jgi:LL-diaminopimelate aminotransferase